MPDHEGLCHGQVSLTYLTLQYQGFTVITTILSSKTGGILTQFFLCTIHLGNL
jgi:hypothetical protein